MLYFTSDLHLFENRNDLNREEGYSEKIIENFKEILSPDDKLLVVGDLAVDYEVVKEFIKEMPCWVGVIKGGSEKKWFPHYVTDSKWDDAISEKMEVFGGDGIPIEWNIERATVLLSHYPVQLVEYAYKHEDSYAKILIHGHVHDSWKKIALPNFLLLNVSVDLWDYKPVSEEQAWLEVAYAREGYYEEMFEIFQILKQKGEI